MDALVNSLGTVWGAPGIIIGLLVLAVGYLYKRAETLQKEHVETLKVTLPLMANFESTMKTAINVLSKSGGEK
jgi:NADH:ubiquinone oxidoreductase subunit 4 (subunit M)